VNEKKIIETKYPYDLVEQIIQERIPLFVAEHLDESGFDTYIIDTEEIHEYLKYYHSITSEQRNEFLTDQVYNFLNTKWYGRNKVVGRINELSRNMYEGNELEDFFNYTENNNQFIDYVISQLLEKSNANLEDNILVQYTDLGYAQDKDYIEIINRYFDEHGY
jgi:hypothetical protein